AEARSRFAQERVEPARLYDGHRHYGSGVDARRYRAAGPGVGPRRRVDGSRAVEILLFSVRLAFDKGNLGLARRRTSRLAAFHSREWKPCRQFAVILRIEPGRSP